MTQRREPEFDKYADRYQDLHAESIRVSGEEPGYFARYKVEEVVRHSTSLKKGGMVKLLDFGCGVGGSIPDFVSLLPNAEIVGVDVSQESLELARSRAPKARFEHFDGGRLPFDDATFDVVFTSCVFHHIELEQRISCLAEIRRVLKPGGEFFFFEHNPWNPLTLRVVRDCPFDENAILLPSPEAIALIKAAGFASPRVNYTVFFPRALAALRPLERFLRHVPIGGQYYVRAHA